MGGLFRLFDFNQSGTMARKILARKKNVEGFEAPRNSLELQLEASQSTSTADNYTVEQDWSEKNSYPFNLSMKTLIKEDISKQRKTTKNTPSIVARLMGVDMLPIDMKSSISHEYKERDFDIWEKGENLGRLRPREHPQEEELQKFKKEFEAWQSARFKECSKIVELERNYDKKSEESFCPKRIVILRPGPDRIFDPEEDSWPSSSCTIDERGSIEDFLEELRERLKNELQGKSRKTSANVRGSGIETPFREKPSDPKQIARHIAKHVRDSVTRNPVRSESTRSYGSEIQINGPDSPEFINRNTRKFLTERLRNVLKTEKHYQDVPFAVNETRIHPRCEEHVMKTRSFRQGHDDLVINRELSPRNLVRSLSAPVSGISFGKLLLEDRHVLTGAHIRRKHESLENKRKKERFNIKEKVSNFRYNFTLRGKLFGKKIQSLVESHGFEQDIVKDIMGRPLVRSFGERHIMENLTEVPPSPASVCSSAQEDFWRSLEYSNPLSTYDENSTMPQVFKEISLNLNELRRQLNQLQSNEPENLKTEMETDDFTMVHLDDKLKAYIRDLLVASGLYDGSFDQWLSRWDPLAEPISKSVFEKLEGKKPDNSKIKPKMDEKTSNKDENDHKLVYDLLNETVAMLIGPPVTMSRLRRKIISSSFLLPLRGRKLLECVWEMMKVYLNPPQDKSCYLVDSTLVENIETSPWSGVIDDEISGFAKDIESEIIGYLVQEIVTDLRAMTATSNNNSDG